MATNSNFSINKIIWALDVFTDIPDVEIKAAKTISRFLKAQKINAKIYPVNVSPGVIKKEHFPFVEIEINKRLSKIKTLKVEPITVIPEKTLYPPSINDKVRTLLNYAKTIKCDLIIVTTHAQQSTSHFIIGSFTNELISESTISLLIFNPKSAVKSQFNKVLLPLENSSLSESQCNLIAQIVNPMNARLTLFFHIQNQAAKYFSPASYIGKIFKNHQQSEARKVKSKQGNLRRTVQDEITNYEIVNQLDELSMQESISRYIKTKNISLLLLGGLGSKLSNTIHTNVVKYVMRSAKCLVFNIR